MKNKYSKWEHEARAASLERDFKDVCRNIFHNEQYIRRLMTKEGAEGADEPMKKISETEQLIIQQKSELEFLKGIIDEFYAKKV